MQGIGVKSLQRFLDEHANPPWLVLDFTGMQLYDTCNRKYQYIREMKLPERKSVPMLYSSMIIHPILARWYTENGQFAPSEAIWRRMWTSYIKAVNEPNVILGNSNIYSRIMAQNIFKQYIGQFALDIDTYKITAIETVYWKELPGVERTIFASKPDLVLTRLGDNALITADFKHSVWDSGEDIIPFDRQFLGQSWAAGSAYMMKNFILVTRDGRIGISRTFKPAATDGDLIVEWLAETVATAQHVIESREREMWRKNAPKACNDFNRKCEFFDLCELGQLRHKVIENLPKVDPLKYLMVDSTED
mgnify:CR=1 FL=1